ncbi:mechanosensitive ion channel protein MscS [Halalkaliarchaeum desulfuricum]|uniref:Mechanosensitive ion channel protein MscS n=1 Tax=Halalkaliarchaeum desulfuricum TaxID=2055893 RepID=A0A343THG3_9EURY|nr:mechanosensitive ion channel family protein [Halalkaliarchaeum desulfuricum]AUX08535.1 mechanosensitive ion channel protein MscS [Halalkaliarchaeum desulfuricum]
MDAETAAAAASRFPLQAGGGPPGREILPDPISFTGMEYLVALAALIAGIYLSKYLLRLLGRPIASQFVRPSIAQTVLRGIRLSVIVLALFFSGWLAGLGFPDIVLSVAVFSAVVGIILAPLVGSIINGLFVLADQPFEIGDMIELDDGTQGFVEDMTIRYTKIFTLDNTFIVIPNANIRERDVTNYSAEDERTRLSLSILITYESNLSQARKVMEQAARRSDAVIDGGPDIRIGSARYPASPTCYIDDYADDGVLLTLRYWARKPYRLIAVRSEVQTNIWEALEDDDVHVDVAYPHQHLIFDETSGRAEVAVSEASELDRSEVATDQSIGPSSDGG